MNVAKLKFVTKRGTLNDATTNVVRLTPKGTRPSKGLGALPPKGNAPLA